MRVVDGTSKTGCKGWFCSEPASTSPNGCKPSSLLQGSGSRYPASPRKCVPGKGSSSGVVATSRSWSLADARSVFEKMPQRDLRMVSWNAMISGYAQMEMGGEALQLYPRMRRERVVVANERNFVAALRAYSNLVTWEEGNNCDAQHHEQKRWVTAGFVGHSVLKTLVNCGSLEAALQVFRGLSHRSVGSWTYIILGHTKAGHHQEALRIYKWMQDEGVEPGPHTIVSLLKSCGSMSDLEEGRRIHAEALRYRCESNLFVSTCLIDMYAKCGSIADAQRVFDGLSVRDVVSWNVMLAGYAQQDQGENALRIYEQMKEECISPNNRTFVSALLACGSLAEREESIILEGQPLVVHTLQRGRAIHAEVQRRCCESDLFVGSALVTMYGKCGSVVDSHIVFARLSQRDVVLWTAMLLAYAQHGKEEVGLQLYGQMQEEGVEPDNRALKVLIQVCGMLAEKATDIIVDGKSIKVEPLRKGKEIHAQAWKSGYGSDLPICNALIGMYGKCGSITDAQIVFDRLFQRDIASWNAMLAAYAQQGDGDKALQLYGRMQEESLSLDVTTFTCILQATSSTGSLSICKRIHDDVVSMGYDSSLLVANTLIHTYGKCASMVDAQEVFDALPQRDVVSWNVLIAGYAREGNSRRCLQSYEEMVLANTKPDGITFLSLLSACNHCGMVEQGLEYFESMTKYHAVVPGLEHYATMVDLLGRAGHLSMVQGLLLEMPMEPNLSIWLSLLAACQKHNNVSLGKHAFDNAVSLQPNRGAAYILMSNIYSHAGMWDHVQAVDGMRQKACACKNPGQTWVEHEQVVYTFVVGDSEQVQSQQIHDLVHDINRFINSTQQK